MRKISLVILAFILVILSVPYFSQVPPQGPGGPPCWPPPCIPIDGGITFFSLIAGWIGYKHLSKNK